MSLIFDTLNANCKRSILYHKEGGAGVRDERDADDGLEKDGRASERESEQVWCSIIGQRSVHYNTMGNAPKRKRRRGREGAIMLRDSSAK